MRCLGEEPLAMEVNVREGWILQALVLRLIPELANAFSGAGCDHAQVLLQARVAKAGVEA